MNITIKKLEKGRIEITNESCLSAYGLPVVRHDGDCDCDCSDKLYADMMCPQVAKNTRVFDYVKQIAVKTKNKKIYDACIRFLKTSPEFDGEIAQAGEMPTDLPLHPDLVYKGKGWKGWKDYLGLDTKN